MLTTATKPHFSILATSFAGGPRPRNAALILSVLWLLLFVASLFAPPILNDADATHANAARSMLSSGDFVTLHVNGVRYLEKAPLPYWLAALSMKLFGLNTFAVHLPQALAIALLVLLGHRWANQAFGARTAFYTSIALLTSLGVFLFTRIFIPEALLSLLLATTLFAFLKSLEQPQILREAVLGGVSSEARPPFPSPDTNAGHPERSAAESKNPDEARHRSRSSDLSATNPQRPFPPPQPTPESPAIAWYAGPYFYPYVLWSALALAVLTKGLIALVFIAIPAILYLTLTDTWHQWRRLKPFTGALIFLAIAAPWHVLAALRNPATADHHGFLWFYFWNEHVLRFLGRRQPQDYQKLPGYLFWLQHLLWLFPWSLFLPLGITALQRRSDHQTRVLTAGPAMPGKLYYLLLFACFFVASEVQDHLHLGFSGYVVVGFVMLTLAEIAFRRRRAGLAASPFHRIDPQQRSILLLSLFAATILLFFSLSTNQEYYTFPAYLPILLLISATITRAEQTYSTSPESRRWITFAHASFTILGAAVAIVLIVCLIASRNLPFNPDIGAALAHRNVADYNLSTSHLFDLTTAAFASLRLPAILAALAFLLGPLAAWHLRMQRRHLAATTTIAFTAAAFLLSAQIAFARFAPMLSSKSFAQTIQHLEQTRQILPDTEVLLYGDQAYGSSIPFYLDQPVKLVESRRNAMQFGSTWPDAPRVFLFNADLAAQWGTGRRKIIAIPAELHEQAIRCTPNATILEQQSGKLLLTDRPLRSEDLVKP